MKTNKDIINEWVCGREEALTELEEIKTHNKDKLDMFIALNSIHALFNESVSGFTKILTNPLVFNTYTKKELKEFMDKYYEFVLEYIKFDIDETIKLGPKIENDRIFREPVPQNHRMIV